MSSTIKYSIALVILLTSVRAARILGLFPIAAKSHFSCNNAFMTSLHAAGHEITMVSPFPSGTEVENFTCIDSRGSNTVINIGHHSVQEFEVTVSEFLMKFILDVEQPYCYDVIKLPTIQEALHSTVKLYDVMFVELLSGYECFLPIAEKLGIPVIGTVTMHRWKLADYIVGVPRNPAVIPFEFAATTQVEMNFIERVQNLWDNFIVDYHFMPVKKRTVDKFYEEYFAEEVQYKKQISMIFYNNHPTLILSRAMPPNAVEVGGVHLMPAKPLPMNLQTFIDEAPHGVILFSFGSVVKASFLPLSQRNAFLAAFSSIPQRVIWKFEEVIEDLPENILLLDWIPQRDILEHKNVVAFISHCGQSGVYEAIATGTPVISVPIFSDQPSNAALLHHRGVSVNLDLKTVTKEEVLAALNAIINDTRYYQRMQELSRAFKDRPLTPQETIVFWTEYVIRHNGAPHLKALGTDMLLYKYLMLDILGVALLLVCVAGFVIYAGARKVIALVGRQSKNVITVKKDE